MRPSSADMALRRGDDPYLEAADALEEFDVGKVPWEERAEKIRERFPTVPNLDWERALDRDIELFARILRDILKIEQAVPGRPGPRPSLDVYEATRRMMQLLGHDFTIQKFPEAFKVLAGKRSIRHLARVTKLERNYVHRLLKGDVEPDGYAMRMIAEAFGKHPSYFLEWRMLYITQAIMRRLEWNPERTVDMFRQLDEQRKKAPF